MRADFYSPIPDVHRLPATTWEEPVPIRGFDLRPAQCLDLLEGPLRSDLASFRARSREPSEVAGFKVDNPYYGPLDADVLYALIRHLRPERVLELGSGFSSLVIAAAGAANAADDHPLRHVVVDPHPSPLLRRIADRCEIRSESATALTDEEVADLAPGDVLFADTTHTVKVGGEVNRLVLEVLPLLRPGVVVHLHDIFLPYAYPRVLLERYAVYWQEQYLVQAFLAFNPEWEVLCANHVIARQLPDRVRAIVPDLPPDAAPSALWLRKVGAAA